MPKLTCVQSSSLMRYGNEPAPIRALGHRHPVAMESIIPIYPCGLAVAGVQEVQWIVIAAVSGAIMLCFVLLSVLLVLIERGE